MNIFLKSFLNYWNEAFILMILFPLIVLLGMYFTCKLRCVQVVKFKEAFKILIKNQSSAKGSISQYEAVAAVLAGNFGTGNISGIAVALTTGGPGALFWMWVMAFFGSIIQYASCILGVQYRQQNAAGEYVGGPMYYLTHGLNLPLLGGI